jgi:hypothetical protein
LASKRTPTIRCKSLLQLAGTPSHYYAVVAVAQPSPAHARMPNELPLLVLLWRRESAFIHPQFRTNFFF